MPILGSIGAAAAKGFGMLGKIAAAVDEYFEYVTLLLHGNGTNGAQNNTFLDSSTNNFTITRNGNTTQGTFTPYGSNWSNYFDGSGDYLSLPSSTNLALGTGAFTIEAWVFNASTEALFPSIGACSSPSGITQFGFSNSANSVTRVVLGNLDYPSSGNSILLKGSASVGVGQWAHVAYVRDSGVITIYLNGVSVGTVSDARDSVQQLRSVGASYSTYFAGLFFEWLGNISNLRFVKGSAVYASNFTPSTAPITAITNTQLLTCQSNRFIDNSSNAFAITVNGNTSVQRFSPFNPTTPYAAGTIGGSGYFDGSGDYLSVASSSTLAFGTGDFTIEGWYYPLAYSGDVNTITSTTTADSASVSAVNINVHTDGSMQIGNLYSTGAGTVPLRAWTYFVVSRVSGTIRLFINGVEKSSASNTTNYTSTGCLIGARFAGSQYYITAASYISGLKFIVGSGVTSVTVPSAPPTGGNVLTNFTNGGIIDNAMMNDLETVGNAQISTSVSKFGGGSMYFDGTGDYLSAPNNQNFVFGTGDFTIEFWYYGNDTDGGFAYLSGGTTGYWAILLYAGSLYFQSASGATNLFSVSAASITNNAWHHVAVARSSGTTRLFFDGVQQASAANTTNYNGAAGSLLIGRDSNGADLTGYIDDLRITKGYARYTANFTPPTAPFPDQ